MRTLAVVIRADTYRLERGLLLAELRLTRSRWRRLRLRFAVWRLDLRTEVIVLRFHRNLR